jgi:L-rhamnose mutarotase
MIAEKDVLRIGMVIKIKPEYIDEYKALHLDKNSGVRDLLTEANMHNFSIFLHQLDDGNWYEFGYYEYRGEDFESDMAKLAEHPRNIEWLKLCDPMQIPLEGYPGWAEMEQIYYNP